MTMTTHLDSNEKDADLNKKLLHSSSCCPISTMSLIIRTAQTNDLEAVLLVHQKAFYDKLQEANLVRLLHQHNKDVISLVAVADGDRIVGSVVFSPVDLDPAYPQLRTLGLAPVGVLPEFQRQRVGSQLIKEGLRLCKEQDYDAIVVLGSPAYYSRFGFLRAKNFGLDNEYKVDEEFMVLELKTGILHNVNGTIKFASEFKEVGC